MWLSECRWPRQVDCRCLKFFCKVQISQQGVFSYAALCRFLKELCINLLIQKYLPAWDCNIYFSCHYPEVTLPSLSSTDLLFRTSNVNVTSVTVIIFCISSMKDWNVITHQYLVDIFLNIRACWISAQSAPLPSLEASYTRVVQSRHLNIVTWLQLQCQI